MTLAELPLTVQLVSVAVPSLHRPPPYAGGVAADGAVGQRESCPVVQAAAVADAGVAAGDRQSRDGRRDTRIDLEHPAQPAAADRHARRRARDRLRPGRVAQLELAAGQGDRLRRCEDGAVEGDGRDPQGIGLAKAMASRRLKRPCAREEGIARRVHDQAGEGPGQCWSDRTNGDKPGTDATTV